MKKVSAESVTEISRKAYQGPLVQSSAPTAQQLISNLRDKLSTPAAEPVAERKRQQRLADLDAMLDRCPEGFALVPVLYTRIEKSQNKSVQNEYSDHVRQKFLKFLAQDQAPALRALGFCDLAIEHMKQGRDPARADGMMYDISIDHIIERSGGGALSHQKTPDVLQSGNPTYGVNHFNNFVLLPEKIHHYKNALNAVQGMNDIRPGQARWFLMMVPKSDHKNAGFVCPPQPPGHYFAGMDMRPQDISRRIGHTAFFVSQTQENIRSLYRNHDIADFITAQEQTAAVKNLTVAELADLEQLTSANQTPPRQTIRGSFNKIATRDGQVQKHIQETLCPGIDEVRELLGTTFNKIAQAQERRTPAAQAHYNTFLSFYSGHKVRRLREETAKLPFAEAAAFLKECARIDREIATLDAKKNNAAVIGKNENDNAPAKKKKPGNGKWAA